MGQKFLRALFDTNILIDLLSGVIEANNELGRYSQVAISRISWIEVLTGEALRFLDRFSDIPFLVRLCVVTVFPSQRNVSANFLMFEYSMRAFEIQCQFPDHP